MKNYIFTFLIIAILNNVWMVNQKAFKYTNLSEYNIIYLTSTCYYWGLFVI